VPWQSEIAVKLSQLIIDADKDWAGKSIVNVGSLSVSGNATVKGVLSVGDIEFRNGWRIVEGEDELLLVSPSGKKYRFVLREVIE
jgi:hypothetical protein